MAFAFQQRTGRLDLRRLSAIDLDHLVKHVDIDGLQRHVEEITFLNLREEDLRLMTDPHVIKLFRTAQLMIEYLIHAQEQLALNLNRLSGKYTEQKRALTRKRRELAELLESTRHLEAEVSSKRKGVATLEKLLQDVHVARGVAVETSTGPPPAAAAAPVAAEPLAAEPAKPEGSGNVAFFVTGPSGLTVECSGDTAATTTVQELVSQIGSSLCVPGDRGLSEIKLVHQGRILPPNTLISSLQLRSGESLVAISPPSARTPMAAKEASISVADLKEMFSQQSESLKEVAVEIRQGWETAVRALAPVPLLSNSEALSQSKERSAEEIELQVFEKMDERWGRLETTMRTQLDQQLSLYTKHLQELARGGYHMHAGDMESDDEAACDKEGLNYKRSLTSIEETIKGTYSVMTDMKDAHFRQSIEISELKKLFSLSTTAAAPAEEPKRSRDDSEVVDFQLGDLSGEMEGAGGEEEAVGSTLLPLPQQPGKYPLQVSFPVAPSIKPVAAVLEDLDESFHSTTIDEVVPLDVCVVFPTALNPDIAAVMKGEEAFSINLPRDLTCDDIVFEMRRAIADLAATSLQRVALNMRGKVVTLGVDVDAGTSPVDVARMAASGELIIKLATGSTMSDAQIDNLVEEWQRAHSRPGSNKQYVRDMGLADAEDEERMMGAMRSSLGKALSELEGLSGLSNEDLQRRMRSLHSTASTLPLSMADTLMDHRQRTIEAMSCMSSDRESEDESESVRLSLARHGIAKGPSIYEVEDEEEEGGDDEMFLGKSEASSDSRGFSSRRYGDENSPRARAILNFEALAQNDGPQPF